MLKYEGIPVGALIRSYDFEPMEGRSESYIEGVVFVSGHHYIAGVPVARIYLVRCTKDTSGSERVGYVIHVPMELAYSEFDNRVTIISKES